MLDVSSSDNDLLASTDTFDRFATAYRRTDSKNGRVERLYLLRSYEHEERLEIERRPWSINFTSEKDMEIWQVARAATAAPMYFGEVEIKTRRGMVYYSDGGFGLSNNPTMEGYRELQTLHRREVRPGKVTDGAIGAIVSIGTARAADRSGGKGILRRIKQAFHRATSPQNVAEAINYASLPNCWRLNDDVQGVDVELDEWKPSGRFTSDPGHESIARMERDFHRWLAILNNGTAIKSCAEELVRRRRARTQNASKWERFAVVAVFRCKDSQCNGSKWDCREDWDDHFKNRHSGNEDEKSYETPNITTWAYQDPNSSRSSTGF